MDIVEKVGGGSGNAIVVGFGGVKTALVETGTDPGCPMLNGGKPAVVVFAGAAVVSIAGAEVTTPSVVVEAAAIGSRMNAKASREAPRLISCFSVKMPSRKRMRGSKNGEQFLHAYGKSSNSATRANNDEVKAPGISFIQSMHTN